MIRTSAVILSFIALTSCTPIEREACEEGIEEIVEYEREVYAPPFPQGTIDDRTAAIPVKPIDTNPATVYKGRKTSKTLYRPDTRGHQAEANYRQYPRRKGTPGRCDSNHKDA